MRGESRTDGRESEIITNYEGSPGAENKTRSTIVAIAILVLATGALVGGVLWRSGSGAKDEGALTDYPALMARGEYDGAGEALRELIALYPGDAQLYIDAAQCEDALSRGDAAKALLIRGLLRTEDPRLAALLEGRLSWQTREEPPADPADARPAAAAPQSAYTQADFLTEPLEALEVMIVPDDCDDLGIGTQIKDGFTRPDARREILMRFDCAGFTAERPRATVYDAAIGRAQSDTQAFAEQGYEDVQIQKIIYAIFSENLETSRVFMLLRMKDAVGFAGEPGTTVYLPYVVTFRGDERIGGTSGYYEDAAGSIEGFIRRDMGAIEHPPAGHYFAEETPSQWALAAGIEAFLRNYARYTLEDGVFTSEQWGKYTAPVTRGVFAQALIDAVSGGISPEFLSAEKFDALGDTPVLLPFEDTQDPAAAMLFAMGVMGEKSPGIYGPQDAMTGREVLDAVEAALAYASGGTVSYAAKPPEDFEGPFEEYVLSVVGAAEGEIFTREQAYVALQTYIEHTRGEG